MDQPEAETDEEGNTMLTPEEAVRIRFADPEPAPEGFTKIKITTAQSDPVPLYVHGVGFWSIRVGEVVTLPVDALDALRNSDCTFTLE